MKCSLGMSNFLEEISSLSHSIVFFYFFALIAEEGFLSLPATLQNSALKWVYLSFSQLFVSPHQTAIFRLTPKDLTFWVHALQGWLCSSQAVSGEQVWSLLCRAPWLHI